MQHIKPEKLKQISFEVDLVIAFLVLSCINPPKKNNIKVNFTINVFTCQHFSKKYKNNFYFIFLPTLINHLPMLVFIKFSISLNVLFCLALYNGSHTIKLLSS